VPAAQQIVSEIQAAKHVQSDAGDADNGDRVVVHPYNCRV